MTRLTLLLPGKGCSWACNEFGGCTMCGFPQKVKDIGGKVTDKNLMSLYETAEIISFKDKPYCLAIYNAGSFINDNEISPYIQQKICEKVKCHHSIKNLFIESRAEFITDSKIKFLKKSLGDKELTVAIGLESQDDKIRNVYIRKGLTKKMYEQAIKILKENNVRSFTYILIKPIFLSEREAIDEAINTAKYAFRCGTDEVAFESTFIQPETLVEQLYNQGKFKPPWLWSIIEVIKRTHYLGNIHIGGFDDEPPPIAIPYNCPECSKKIEDSFQKYRETHNIGIFDNLDCSCKKIWQKITKF